MELKTQIQAITGAAKEESAAEAEAEGVGPLVTDQDIANNRVAVDRHPRREGALIDSGRIWFLSCVCAFLCVAHESKSSKGCCVAITRRYCFG